MDSSFPRYRKASAAVLESALADARLQGWRNGCADIVAVIEAMVARARGSGSPRNARIWAGVADMVRALPEPDYSEEADQ